MDKLFMILFFVIGAISILLDSDALAIISFLSLWVSVLIKWYNYNGS